MFDARYSIRTHVACAVTADTVGATVTVAGWVAKRRDHGGLIFIDLRDRSGIVQCTFDPEASGAAFVTPNASGPSGSSSSPASSAGGRRVPRTRT